MEFLFSKKSLLRSILDEYWPCISSAVFKSVREFPWCVFGSIEACCHRPLVSNGIAVLAFQLLWLFPPGVRQDLFRVSVR